MILIDKEKLFSERPEYRNPIHEKNSDFNKGWNACVDTFCDIIKEQPTAYDVDKVLKKLESLNPVDYGSMFSYEGHSCAREIKRDAIDIVERGGVDDN